MLSRTCHAFGRRFIVGCENSTHNGYDHRGGGRRSFHSAHLRPPPPVHRLVRGLRSSVAGAALDDRRPVGGASSYRAAATVASICFSRPASGNPNRASHRRYDSVSREEPHVRFVRVASALKGLDKSAQGKATPVVRASPPPWVAYQRGKKALKGRDNRCFGLCRPFRAGEPIATTTRGGATLCPGLICPCPFRAHHRGPQHSERWRDHRSNRERPARRTNPATETR
jgi:hypothetical protein